MADVVFALMLLMFLLLGYRAAQFRFAGERRELSRRTRRILRIPPLELGHAEGDETYRFLFGAFGVGVAHVGGGRSRFVLPDGTFLTLGAGELHRVGARFRNGAETFVIEPPAVHGRRRLRKGLVFSVDGLSMERALAAQHREPPR